MKNLLAIEASTSLCSVALSFNGEVFELNSDEPRAHTASLFAFVDQLLAKAAIDIRALDGIAFSAGPGSFTGIRLAAAVAKSLAYAANIPALGVSSLAAMAEVYYRSTKATHSCLVVSDARMDEYYVGEYQQDSQGFINVLQHDCLLTPEQLVCFAHQSLVIVSDGSDWVQKANLNHLPQVAVRATAATLLILAEQQLLREVPAKDSALTVQVNYLRDKSGWKNVEQQKRNPVQGV